MFEKLAKWEEDRWNDLVERAAEKQPEAFWADEQIDKGWELKLLNHWPHKLSIGYWYYIFSDLEGKRGYSSDPNPNWINIPQWGEIRFLFQKWDAKSRKMKWEWNPKWVWIQLTDETKGRRLICRLRGHPNGEVYYTSYGYEPDHRCKDCGEEIG